MNLDISFIERKPGITSHSPLSWRFNSDW